MQNETSYPADDRDSLSEARLTLIEAVARKQAVEARYNGTVIKLAPHLIFERHGDLFVSALNMSKTWRADEEPRLGQFKIAGLREIALLDQAFDAVAAYDGAAPRSDDVVVLTI